MTYLLDINVLLALAWPSHADHSKASAWLADRKNEKSGIATCPQCELGFLRLSMQLMKSDFASAAALLKELYSSRHLKHSFFTETFSPFTLTSLPIRGFKQVNDFFLAELAGRHHAKFATFDTGINHPSVVVV